MDDASRIAEPVVLIVLVTLLAIRMIGPGAKSNTVHFVKGGQGESITT